MQFKLRHCFAQCCIRFMIFAVNPGYGYMCGLDFYRFSVLLLIRTAIVHTSRKCILYKIFLTNFNERNMAYSQFHSSTNEGFLPTWIFLLRGWTSGQLVLLNVLTLFERRNFLFVTELMMHIENAHFYKGWATHGAKASYQCSESKLKKQ